MLYLLRWLRSWWGGYFWLPCALCSKKYGGFEMGDRDGHHGSIPLTIGRSQGICPTCTLAGKGDEAWAASQWR